MIEGDIDDGLCIDKKPGKARGSLRDFSVVAPNESGSENRSGSDTPKLQNCMSNTKNTKANMNTNTSPNSKLNLSLKDIENQLYWILYKFKILGTGRPSAG